jgi:hypothetical protein
VHSDIKKGAKEQVHKAVIFMLKKPPRAIIYFWIVLFLAHYHITALFMAGLLFELFMCQKEQFWLRNTV